METLSYTYTRSHLAETMENVCNNHVPIIVTRAKAKPVVMISLEDFEAFEETHYLMKSPKNAARLTDAINEIEAMIEEKKEEKKSD